MKIIFSIILSASQLFFRCYGQLPGGGRLTCHETQDYILTHALTPAGPLPVTLEERSKWLSLVDALPDEWVVERKIQLLIDKGSVQAARELLLSTRFQKVHQTYTRTGLWQQICEKLHLPFEPVPLQLGEDRLARFGAYREYE